MVQKDLRLLCLSTGIPPQSRLVPQPACRLPVRAPPKSACSDRGDRGPLWQPSPPHILRSPLFLIECLRFLAGHGDRGPAGDVSTVLADADCWFQRALPAADLQAWSLSGNRARHRGGTPREPYAPKKCPPALPLPARPTGLSSLPPSL